MELEDTGTWVRLPPTVPRMGKGSSDPTKEGFLMKKPFSLWRKRSCRRTKKMV